MMKLTVSCALMMAALFCCGCSGSTVPGQDSGPGTDTNEVTDLDVPSDVAGDPDVRPDIGNLDNGSPDGTMEVFPDVGIDADSEVMPDALPDEVDPADGFDAVDTTGTDLMGDVPVDVQVDTNGPAAKVVVNEVVAAPLPDTLPDWVELYNAGDAVANLTGWTMRDEDDAHIYTILDGTTLQPGAFLVLEGIGGTGPQVFNFRLGAKADQVRIFDAATTVVDSVTWSGSPAPAGSSWGRYPDGTGEFMTLSTPTQGTANVSNL